MLFKQMKVKILTLILLSTNLLCYSQKSEEEGMSNKNKFTIGLYSGYQHNINAYKSTQDDIFSYNAKNEGLAYGAELGYFY